ncbi:phospholipid scramblase 2 [Biomphalaria glabrata]|uniref:Phospholipid scramblase n=1 Tax=Biomphalaria glabrata TaxID=6526 RepID=A0A2C9JF58_BIOGL|nr:phospholipid scramblase 2-like [Biomphalaria glabrata]XP_013067494.1 phospholipid scramblase 2-like [Biomphalaria glabrata]XP_013067495.1 phospholipid scramblase 2-like [Biomphalaria glabrata]XP_055868553.1 phospholipid scramblase 2-like [Biomphalaria glabrata]KAI8751170.1 phospholipid scramblase 2-like [Biomphalaria glabrata]KAI8772467.1 phospholipid scramblase 2 [Biomphalaria glabrata]
MSDKPPPPEVYPGPTPYPTAAGQGYVPPPVGFHPDVAPPAAGYQAGGYPAGGGYPTGGGYPPSQQYPGYPNPQGDVIAMQPMPGGHPNPGYQQPSSDSVAVQPMPGAPPAPAGWSPSPQAPPVSCPPGLEYLTQVDQLLVKQKIEALEAFTGFETNNKYEVKNSMNQRVFIAVEDTCCCTRNCCGSARPFDMKIMDNHKKEIIHLSRPLRCSTCWCPCCLQKLTVEAPKGSVIGYVRQAWSLCHPKYKINNAEDQTMLRIKGPCCRCNICGDIEFEVTSPDEQTHVGQITKQWSGLAKEVFTDADNFGVTFPLDLDVKTKATVLGAVFLIDFMYFEHDSGDVKDEAKRLRG